MVPDRRLGFRRSDRSSAAVGSTRKRPDRSCETGAAQLPLRPPLTVSGFQWLPAELALIRPRSFTDATIGLDSPRCGQWPSRMGGLPIALASGSDAANCRFLAALDASRRIKPATSSAISAALPTTLLFVAMWVSNRAAAQLA